MKIILTITVILLLFISCQQVTAQDSAKPKKEKILFCSDCIARKVISVPKPEYPNAPFSVRGVVQVQILVDEKGNVIEAEAISGHPLLKPISVKAALQAKFKPMLLSGNPVKVRGVIAFNFVPNESVQTKETEDDRAIKGGIVNGKAINLPKPDYPQEAKDFCASGQVQVEVLISENGSVISAKAISGDELLRNSAVEATKKAKFSQTPDLVPIKMKGIVVYNFVPKEKCIVVGIVNKKALSIPKPQVGNIIHPKHLRISEEQTVEVQIIIEISSGKVLRARAIYGHPMLRAACEASARQAKFSPTNDLPNIPIRAILTYKFKPDGTIEF